MSSKNNRLWGGGGDADKALPSNNSSSVASIRSPEQIIREQAAAIQDFRNNGSTKQKGGGSVSSTGSVKAAGVSGRYRATSPTGGPPSTKADDVSRRAQAVASLAGKGEPGKKQMQPGCLAVHVRGKVIAGGGEAFYRHTLSQARSSVLEPGLSQLYLLNALDDSSEFLLVEVYPTPAAHEEHRGTKHYAAWRDAVNDLMVEPTTTVKFATLFPPKTAWKKMDASAASSAVNLDGHLKALPWKYKPFSAAPPDAPQAPALAMFAVLMEIEVKPGCENSFIEETIANCRQSIKEPGVHQFNFLRNADQKNKFILFKVYSNASAQNDHFQVRVCVWTCSFHCFCFFSFNRCFDRRRTTTGG